MPCASFGSEEKKETHRGFFLLLPNVVQSTDIMSKTINISTPLITGLAGFSTRFTFTISGISIFKMVKSETHPIFFRELPAYHQCKIEPLTETVISILIQLLNCENFMLDPNFLFRQLSEGISGNHMCYHLGALCI